MTAIFRPPVCGPGAVYLPPYAPLFLRHSDVIKVAEVEPQPLWVKPADAPPHGSDLHLARLREMPQSFLLHGIGAPLGGVNDAADDQMSEFRRWLNILDVKWTSEHMSLLAVESGSTTQNVGFLMPPLQTDEVVTQAARTIKRRAERLGRPIAFETGVNYFAPRTGEMEDGDFWRAIAQEANCGILLDITNLWVNQRNGRASVADTLAKLPLDRVWEIHLAGAEFLNGMWLDAHSGAINPDVIALATEITGSLPNLSAIIFEVASSHFPRLGEAGFMQQMETVNRLWEARREPLPNVRYAKPVAVPIRDRQPLHFTARSWEGYIGDQLLTGTARPQADESAEPVRFEDIRSFAVYAHLIRAFRRGVITELFENATRLLFMSVGADAATSFIDDYLDNEPAHFFASDEARHFAAYVRKNDPHILGYTDCTKFEAALIEAVAEQGPVTVELNCDIERLLTAIAAQRLPDRSTIERHMMIEVSAGANPKVVELETV